MGTNEQQSGKRRPGRPSIIGSSPHRDEYHTLLLAGWSSYSLEKYALHRYGEDISARVFRLYKARKKIEAKPDPLKEIELDDIPDVMRERIRICLLQKERIAIDAKHEQGMGKLFTTLGREIELYSKLLSELRADLQEVGLLPKPGDPLHRPKQEDDNSPAARSLAEVFAANQDVEAELAKVLHLSMHRPDPSPNGHATSNGQVS